MRSQDAYVRRVFHIRAAMISVFVFTACGGPSERAANHADFDIIQRQETQLEVHEAELQRLMETDSAVDAQNAAAAGVCDAAARVCNIAAELTDIDAAHRCRAAEARCERAEATVARADRGE